MAPSKPQPMDRRDFLKLTTGMGAAAYLSGCNAEARELFFQSHFHELDPEELRLRFSRPGEDTDVVIQRHDGAVRVDRERSGLLAAFTDIHRGKRSGTLGKLLVDATAILLISISLSGFVLWLTLPKRRRLGLAALVLTLGALATFGCYLLL